MSEHTCTVNIQGITNTSVTHTVDATGMCLVSSERAYLLGRLSIEEEGLAVSTSGAEQFTIGRETDNVYKAIVYLNEENEW